MKEKLRKEISAMRDNLSEKEHIERSEIVKERLFETEEFKKAKTIMFYVSKGSEVRTEHMITESIKMGKTVVVPLSDSKTHTLCAYEIEGVKDLCPGCYGIPEPDSEKCRKVEPEEIDLVIVPGTAFDKKGDRIGYGMGFYDKFLSQVKIKTIGLAYDFQVVVHIPGEEHDVKVDMVVMDNGALRF